jgi:hypothetical protein
MKSKKRVEYPMMGEAATYRIRVHGRLDPKLSDRVEGMHIDTLTRDDGTAESVLEGRLADQAALTGVLNTLYELHLPVISADCLGEAD